MQRFPLWACFFRAFALFLSLYKEKFFTFSTHFTTFLWSIFCQKLAYREKKLQLFLFEWKKGIGPVYLKKIAVCFVKIPQFEEAKKKLKNLTIAWEFGWNSLHEFYSCCFGNEMCSFYCDWQTFDYKIGLKLFKKII